MRRRDFIMLLSGTAAAWPIAAQSQEAGRTYRVGGLSVGPRSAPYWLGVFDELRRAGFVEGENLTIDWHQYGPHVDLIPQFAAELVKAKVDVIVATGDTANSRRSAGDNNNSHPRQHRRYGRIGLGKLDGSTRWQYDRYEHLCCRA